METARMPDHAPAWLAGPQTAPFLEIDLHKGAVNTTVGVYDFRTALVNFWTNRELDWRFEVRQEIKAEYAVQMQHPRKGDTYSGLMNKVSFQ